MWFFFFLIRLIRILNDYSKGFSFLFISLWDFIENKNETNKVIINFKYYNY